MDNKKEILKIYNLLKGTCNALREKRGDYITKEDIDKFNELLDNLYELTNDGYVDMYKMQRKDILDGTHSSKEIFIMRVVPIVEYINNIYIDTTEETIQKVGALYNSIEDAELQKRCGDILLESTDAFDRVINQATQILEDRIKKKAKLDNSALIGLPLVSRAIHSKIDNTIIKFSDEPNIQEQYANLFKGIIGVYRNPTHHGLDYDCTREEALKFCAYIDTLLKKVENAEVLV